MTGNSKPKRAKLFYISQRDNVSLMMQIMVRVIALLLATLICGIITKLLSGENPLKVIAIFFEGAFSKSRLLPTIHELAILLCISIAVTPVFRMKFWNIGAEGQVLVGCLATAICMLTLGGKVPDWVLMIIMAIFAIIAGIIWAVIPAVFKAQWKTNETLFTLMMNYVAIQLVEYFLKIADKTGSNTVGPRLLAHGWLPKVFGVPYLFNIIIVAVITVVVYIYLNYSKHGYDISVVGESENTARYIGINVKKVIIRTALVSGAICGIAGLLLVGGYSHSIDSNLVAGRGFTAIMVSWLAKFNPFTMILTTLLLVFVGRGADQFTQITKYGLNGDFTDIITGIILFFVIGCEFFINYQIHFSHRSKEGE